MKNVCLRVDEIQHIQKVRAGMFIDRVEGMVRQTEDEDTSGERVG